LFLDQPLVTRRAANHCHCFSAAELQLRRLARAYWVGPLAVNYRSKSNFYQLLRERQTRHTNDIAGDLRDF
jgi:hypothetical protein